MSNYEQRGDDVQVASASRDRTAAAAYPAAPPQMLPPSGYELRLRRAYPIETKPFFLTSEFVGAVLAVAGIAVTAASSDAFGAWRAWILISAITVGYIVSRGIAKSGTRSHADDPREHLNLSRDRSTDRSSDAD